MNLKNYQYKNDIVQRFDMYKAKTASTQLVPRNSVDIE